MQLRVAEELERHRVRLFGYALSLTGKCEEADDLLQECAVKALSASSVPDDRRACRAWLFRILRNAWIDQYRRRSVISVVGLDETAGPADMVSACEERLIDVIAVKQALARIPVAHREIVSLVDAVGCSYSEAGEILGIPVGTVMSRLSRARKALLAELGSHRQKK